MNPFEMVLGIIIVVTIGSVLKARYGGGKDRDGGRFAPADRAAEADNARLRDEIRGLRERISVLERVITDTHGSMNLDREIEKLRNDNRV